MSKQHQEKQNRKGEYEPGNFTVVNGSGNVDDWTSTELFAPDRDADPIQGIIVARMPDLGECRSFSDSGTRKNETFRVVDEQSDSRSSESVFPIKPSFYEKFALRPIQWTQSKFSAWRNRTNETPKESASRPFKPAHTRFILAGIVLLICGIALVSWNKKEKDKEIAAIDNPQVEGTKPVQPNEKPATPPVKSNEKKPATTPVKSNEKKPAATPVKSDEKKPATSVKPDEKKPATSVKPDEKKPTPPVKSDEKKPVTPVKSDEKKPASAPKKTNPDSPWDRAATDNYSPWTMTSSSRLEGTSEKPREEDKDNKTDTMATDIAASALTTPVTASDPIASTNPVNPTNMGHPHAPVMATTSPIPGTMYPQGTYPQGMPVQPGATIQPTGAYVGNHPPVQFPVQGNTVAPGGYASSSQYGNRPIPQQVSMPSPMLHAAVPQGPYAASYNTSNPPMVRNANPAPPVSGRVPLAESHATYRGPAPQAGQAIPNGIHAGQSQGGHYVPSPAHQISGGTATPNYVAVSPQAPYPNMNPPYPVYPQGAAATNPAVAPPVQQPYSGGVAQPVQPSGVNGWTVPQTPPPAGNGQVVLPPYQQSNIPQAVPTGRYY